MVHSSASQPLSPHVSDNCCSPIGGGGPELLGKPTEPPGKGSPGKSDITYICVHGPVPLRLGGDVSAPEGEWNRAPSHVSPHIHAEVDFHGESNHTLRPEAAESSREGAKQRGQCHVQGWT